MFLSGSEWEDAEIFINLEDAISQSIKYPNCRIEIFTKNNLSYVPTYNYIINGQYIIK